MVHAKSTLNITLSLTLRLTQTLILTLTLTTPGLWKVLTLNSDVQVRLQGLDKREPVVREKEEEGQFGGNWLVVASRLVHASCELVLPQAWS